jgi:hypothetical protein
MLAAMTSLAVRGSCCLGFWVDGWTVLVMAMVLIGGSSVFEWPCCVCSQTRLGPGPRQRGRQVQGVGKVADRPAEGRRKRIPGAARSFFHRLARARSRAPQQVWFPCRARSVEIAFAVVFVLCGGALRGGWLPAGMGRGRRRHHRWLERGKGAPSR